MRKTQFIGLTQAAQDFVAKCREIVSTRTVFGTLLEELPLREWLATPEEHGIESWKCITELRIREVQQCVYWSSGPMIFTRLELDFGNGGTIPAYEWVHDPHVKDEFDCESGRLWV